MSGSLSASKILTYNVLAKASIDLSKLGTYNVLSQSGMYVSKIVTYAVLAPVPHPPTSPPARLRMMRLRDEDLDVPPAYQQRARRAFGLASAPLPPPPPTSGAAFIVVVMG